MWKAIKLVLYSILYQLACGAVGAGINIVINLIDDKPLVGDALPAWMLSLTMVVSSLLMIFHLFYFRYIDFKRDFSVKIPFATLLLCLLWVIATAQVVSFVIEEMNLPNYMKDTFEQISKQPLGILSVILLAPVMEEMLFRGAVQGYLLRIGKSPLFAIVVSALIFGLIHMNPVQIPFAFILGLLLGWLYYRTGSLLPAIMGHIVNNSLALFMQNLFAGKSDQEVIGDTAAYVVLSVSLLLVAGLFFLLNRRLPHTVFYQSPAEEV